MVYLAPRCRKKVLIVLAGASAIGCLIWAFFIGSPGSAGLGSEGSTGAETNVLEAIRNLAFALSAQTDGYVLPSFSFWRLRPMEADATGALLRHTAPLFTTALAAVFLFSLAPAIRIWDATLGLSFVFIFKGGMEADFVEAQLQQTLFQRALFSRALAVFLALHTSWILRAVLTVLRRLRTGYKIRCKCGMPGFAIIK